MRDYEDQDPHSPLTSTAKLGPYASFLQNLYTNIVSDLVFDIVCNILYDIFTG